MDVTAQKAHKRCNGKGTSTAARRHPLRCAAGPAFQVSPRPSLSPGRFTVAAKGTVTVNCSPDNLREAQFSYGDPFCISLYQAHSNANNDTKTNGNGTATGLIATASEREVKPGRGLLSNNGATASVAQTIRSCAFGGRLKETGQRTFVYNKVGIRIGTFISTSAPPSTLRRVLRRARRRPGHQIRGRAHPPPPRPPPLLPSAEPLVGPTGGVRAYCAAAADARCPCHSRAARAAGVFSAIC